MRYLLPSLLKICCLLCLCIQFDRDYEEDEVGGTLLHLHDDEIAAAFSTAKNDSGEALAVASAK